MASGCRNCRCCAGRFWSMITPTRPHAHSPLPRKTCAATPSTRRSWQRRSSGSGIEGLLPRMPHLRGGPIRARPNRPGRSRWCQADKPSGVHPLTDETPTDEDGCTSAPCHIVPLPHGGPSENVLWIPSQIIAAGPAFKTSNRSERQRAPGTAFGCFLPLTHESSPISNNSNQTGK
jgi:hypothetical protein